MSSWHADRRLEGSQRRSGVGQGKGLFDYDQYRRTGHFAQAGVERQSGATGFAYGSDENYNPTCVRQVSWHGHKLDNRTSAERVKIKKQQKEIEDDHHAFLAKRDVERKEKVEEQQKDLQQLQQYNPWGRPAGGAPRVNKGIADTRMQKLALESDSPRQSHSDNGYDPYGKPGAGAPLRSKSGKLTTQIKGDRDIRFQDHLKKEVDQLRYVPDETETQRSQPKQQDHWLDRADSEKLRIAEEKNKKMTYGRKLEEQCVQAVERREREKREEKHGPTEYIWGKHRVHRDDSGKLLPRKRVIDSDYYTDRTSETGINSLAAQMGRGGAGAPIKDNTGSVNTKVSKSNVNSQGQRADEFDPWGKPGAGAPLRDKQGQVVAAGVYGRRTGELEKKSAHQIVTVDKNKAGRQYGIDVATWMRSKDVEKPSDTMFDGASYNDHKFQDTKGYYTDLQAQAECRHMQRRQRKHEDRQLDALHSEAAARMWEKAPAGNGRKRWEETRNKEYSDDLRKAIEERSVQKKQSRENNIAMERKHAYTFDQHWGRPGAGAPRFDSQGQIDALPKNRASLESQVHTGWHFRN